MQGIVLSLLLAAVFVQSQDVQDVTCGTSDGSAGRALMQRKKEMTNVQAGEHTRRTYIPSKVATLLATEMEELASTRGQVGLTPDEIDHINSIKDMIVGSILPSITDGVDESRAEIATLFEAVTQCVDHVTTALQDVAGLEGETTSNKQSHATCRLKEDDLIGKKEHWCKALEKAKLGVHVPELDFEVNMDISDSEMLHYLREMDNHFCGRWSEFKDTWEECEDYTNNYTATNEECVDLQGDLEESWCAWKDDLEETCEEFDRCWTASLQRYNERKQAIQDLQATRLAEYEGALKVNCLWDAWKWDADPCTIDEAKAKECHEEFAPDLTAIHIDYPEPPVPPVCDVEPVSVYPCTEGFFAQEYAAIGVRTDLVTEMKDGCTQCALKPAVEPVLETEAVAMTARTALSTSNNVQMVSKNLYMKSGGKTGVCDATVQSVDGTATFVSVKMLESQSKAKVTISDGMNTQLDMVLENEVASAAGHHVRFKANKDILSISIRDGVATFSKGPVAFAMVKDTALSSGTAKVAICKTGSSAAVTIE